MDLSRIESFVISRHEETKSEPIDTVIKIIHRRPPLSGRSSITEGRAGRTAARISFGRNHNLDKMEYITKVPSYQAVITD